MSNIKEPYSISVWTEELIPAQSYYYKNSDFTGDYLTEKEYQDPKYFQNWVESQEKDGVYYYLYDHTIPTKTAAEVLELEIRDFEFEKIIMEHYEETQGIIIGAHDMDSVYAAVNPILKKNINGSIDLTFGLYYKVFDPDVGDFCTNPFTSMLGNETKIKVYFRNKWYDLIVKNRVEDSTNFLFNYTCKDIYVNELNKNGFKVELDVELENNQGTAPQLAETILSDTDWTVDTQNSDILVETKIEPLYIGTLNRSIEIKMVNKYVPEDLLDVSDQPETYILPKGVDVLLFYSDITENKKHPQLLCRFAKENGATVYQDPSINPEAYKTDTNEDIIINACNYTTVDNVLFLNLEEKSNIPNIVENELLVYDRARGEKVIKSQLSGYDPDTDKFIFKFYKKNENGEPDTTKEYYGYAKVDILSSKLAQNYLANSDNFISLDSGWVFEGVPARTTKSKGVEKTAGYSGQLYTMEDNTVSENDKTQPSESVLVLQLKNDKNSEFYPDVNGEYYCYEFETIDNVQVPKKVIEVSSEQGKTIEANARASAFEFRKNGVDGYVDKTDEEILSIVNDLLHKQRYSKRARYAINTGVAANRQIIESLTPNEEYLFAVSVGKFLEGEKEPEYGRTINYGTKTPSEFYTFENITDSNDFASKAGEEAKDEADNKIKDHPYQYYLLNPDYKKAYDAAYNQFVKERKEEYKDRYLNIFNNANDRGIDIWRGGGRKYRELFLEYLRDNKTFNYSQNGNAEPTYFCTTIAERLIALCNNKNDDGTDAEEQVARSIYEILIDRPEDFNEETNPLYANKHGYYSGLYPAMAFRTVEEAEEKQEKTLFDAKWEPMGYDKGQYPEFDGITQDLVILERSFNEMLFADFYYTLREHFSITDSNNILSWDTDFLKKDEATTDEEHLYKVKAKVSSILKTIYKTVYENGTWYKAASKAQQYELPTAFDKQGGDIYQKHLQNWISGNNYINLGTREEPNVINTNAEKEGQKAIDRLEKENLLFKIPDSIDYKALGNFMLKKEEGFNVQYSVGEIGGTDYNNDYNEALLGWIREYLDGTISSYYYTIFTPIFMKNWRNSHEVGTYVYNDHIFPLNEGDSGTFVTTPVWRQNDELSWIKDEIKTQQTRATWCAVKTNYNPYTNENQESAGGYVFDRNTKELRLFNLDKDILNATYKPIKDEDGDYIFDAFQQQYRPFRNWSKDVKKNPLTFEEDEELGVYGDITQHPMKWFDGHIGSWEEVPTRYRMVRLREDPLGEDYVYLDNELYIIEEGHYKGKNYKYVNHYPVGYQVDNYIEDNDGKYVLTSDIKPKTFGLIRDEDGKIKFVTNNNNNNNKSPVLVSIKDSIRSFINDIKDFFGVEADENMPSAEDNCGIKESNVSSGNSNYDEDRISEKVYEIEQSNGSKVKVTAMAIDEIENPAEVAQNEDKLEESTQGSTADNPAVAESYTKYKWYYWRHWGKKRYNCKPKICVYRNINGVVVYKPFNKVEDGISDDYKVVPINKVKTETIAFYLTNPTATYRQAKEVDYGTRKYKMQLQDKKRKEYWIESPTGEDFLRHYKFGDGEIRLFDGHFGKWVDCFKEIEVAANSEFSVNPDQNTGLIYIEDEDKYYLPDFYLPYGDKMIPFDARVFGRKERFTRKRVSYDENACVYQDGIYVPLSLYRDNYGFTNILDYTGLRVSIIDNYDYDASNFAIKNIPKERSTYLTFELKDEPAGTMVLPVSNKTITSEAVYEKWIYWIAKVNKGISLTADPFQKFGVFFEKEDIVDENGKVINSGMTKYPFLGMQLFKHIPYERTIKDDAKPYLLVPTKENEYTIKTIFNDVGFIEDSYDDWEDIYNPIKDSEESDILSALNPYYINLLLTIYNVLFAYGENQEENVGVISNNLDIFKKLKANPYKEKLMIQFFEKYGVNLSIQYAENLDKNLSNVKLTTTEKTEIIPLFPEQPPDAKDLKRTNYYIYDPEKITDSSNVVCDYVGTNPYEEFEPAYDELCQKIRSIKGKESNYFKLLQDVCDSFDCWVDPIIEHENNGQVKYIEKIVYIDPLQTEEGPQIYVGEERKKKMVDDRIRHLQLKYGVASDNPRVSFDNELKAYIWVSDEECEPEEYNDIKELNRLTALQQRLNTPEAKQFILVPDKKIRFKRYVGQENWNGFKYGVNLKHIKRTIDSNQISTRVIVKPNKNEHAKDNFCTIQRAEENVIKENFLLDFSYYVQQGLLDNTELINDLYSNFNTKLDYFNKLARLNRDNDNIADRLASLNLELDKVKADFDTATLAYEAAQQEIQKIAYTLTSNYDTYGQIIDTPWTRNKSQEYELRTQTSAPATTFQMQIEAKEGDAAINITIDVPKTATQVEYPKYNDALRTLLDQMDIYQLEAINNKKVVDKLKPEKERIEKEIQELINLSKIIVEKKNELNRLFYHKYARYIQEGSWIDENYIDDNLYYLDALSVIRTSCKPKITYDIGVVDIAAAYEYEEDRIVLESELGDRTYVEDTEFFGYQKDKVTPYWEMVVVSEKIYNLEDASQNQTKVKNYSTQFDDLFQRIAATSQTLQFNEGSYNRAASLINENGTIKADVLQQSVASSDFILSTSINENVNWNNTGLTVTSKTDRSNVLKIVSRGILISNDGGNNFTTAITGDGLNASIISAGRINIDNLLIGGDKNPNFFWDSIGISAYSMKDSNIDYSTFVRMDKFGFYGVKGDDTKKKLSYTNTFAPKSLSEVVDNPNVMFGLTWNGFLLRSGDETGRVTIGTDQDFRMSEYSYSNQQWQDRVIIGRMEDNNGETYYGFRLKDSTGATVMDTNDRGELYLKEKLRISNFDNNQQTESQYIYDKASGGYYAYFEENGKIYKHFFDENYNEIGIKEETSEKWSDIYKDPQDRVSLGIVNIYKREGKKYKKTGIPKNTYSSINYLTKVFSVKANGNIGLEQFNEAQIPQLIEQNENFAIFDNGNLYAKNAWIEGHIRATSGSFTGNIEASSGNIGGIVINPLNDNDGGIQSKNYSPLEHKGWKLSQNGDFELNNGTFHGTIQATNGYILKTMYIGSTEETDNKNIVKIGNIGSYDSESVIKVFSITNKIDKVIATDNISQYVNAKETFAIFDNGLLYATNAYIKGNIEATSGSFTGKIEAESGKIGDILINSGGLQTENYPQKQDDQVAGWRIGPDGDATFYNIDARGGTIGGLVIGTDYIAANPDSTETNGWSINSDGTATFRNVNVSGKITSAIFEHDKIQTIAGSMLIRPAIYYIDYATSGNYIKVLIDSKELPNEFSIGSKVKIGNEIVGEAILYTIISESSVENVIWNKENIVETNQTCLLYLEKSSDTSFENDAFGKAKILLYMGTGQENESVIGLGLNASTNATVLPSESFSIIELTNESYKPRAIFGKIPGNIIATFRDAASTTQASDTYGLYADEVYLKGEIIATAGKIGGLIIAEQGLYATGQDNKSWSILSDGTANFTNGNFTGIINAVDGGTIGDIIIADGGLKSQPQTEDKPYEWEILPDGTVRFEQAYLQGEIIASSGTIGNITIEEKSISAQYGNNTGWKISSGGDCYFNNLLLTGSMIMFSAATVTDVKINPESTTLYLALEDEKISYIAESIEESGDIYVYLSSLDTAHGGVRYKALSHGKEAGTERLYVTIDAENIVFNKNDTLFIVPDNEDVPVYGIVFNSSAGGSFPKKSISIVDLLTPQNEQGIFNTKLVLGYLSEDLFDTTSLAKKVMSDSYGLYSDNVFLKGSIISESADYIAGLTTQNLLTINDEKIIFFAGQAGQQLTKDSLKFYVTEKGALYAEDGYFKGIIEASEIRGGGKGVPGLVFKDMAQAIHFKKSGPTKDQDISIFTLSDENASFYKDGLKVFDISLNENPSLKMFETLVEDSTSETKYLFAIEKNTKDEIIFKYNNTEVITLNSDGAHLGKGNNGIGDNAYFEEVKSNNTNKFIGYDIILI